MEKHALEIINERHLHQVDKLFRMCGGLASRCIDYRGRTIYLNIRVTPRWRKDPTATAIQLGLVWKKSNPELSKAKRVAARIEFTTQNGQKVTSVKVVAPMRKNLKVRWFGEIPQNLLQELREKIYQRLN